MDAKAIDRMIESMKENEKREKSLKRKLEINNIILKLYKAREDLKRV